LVPVVGGKEVFVLFFILIVIRGEEIFDLSGRKLGC
jgi:hypothetical protein